MNFLNENLCEIHRNQFFDYLKITYSIPVKAESCDGFQVTSLTIEEGFYKEYLYTLLLVCLWYFKLIKIFKAKNPLKLISLTPVVMSG